MSGLETTDLDPDDFDAIFKYVCLECDFEQPFDGVCEFCGGNNLEPVYADGIYSEEQ